MPGYDDELTRIVEELNRAAPGGKPPDKTPPRPPASTASLEQLLAYAARQGASDVVLVAGSAIAMRVNGAWTPASGPSLSPEDVRSLLLPLLSSAQYEELQRAKSVDFSFVRDPIGRFRAN